MWSYEFLVGDVAHAGSTGYIGEHTFEPLPVAELLYLPRVAPQVVDAAAREHIVEHIFRETVPVAVVADEPYGVEASELEYLPRVQVVVIAVERGLRLERASTGEGVSANAARVDEARVLHHAHMFGRICAARITERRDCLARHALKIVFRIDNLCASSIIGQVGEAAVGHRVRAYFEVLRERPHLLRGQPLILCRLEVVRRDIKSTPDAILPEQLREPQVEHVPVVPARGDADATLLRERGAIDPEQLLYDGCPIKMRGCVCLRVCGHSFHARRVRDDRLYSILNRVVRKGMQKIDCVLI